MESPRLMLACVRALRASAAIAAMCALAVVLVGAGTEKAHGASLQTYAGATRFDTAASQARAAYGSCDAAVLVGDTGWSDALSATGLAGALDCPVLFTGRDSLHPSTASALSDLGVRRVVVVGGYLAVGDQVLDAVEGRGMAVERIWGENSYATQMAVYDYGDREGLWGGGTVVVATGTGFADALSAAPVAFAEKAPVFLVDGGRDLSAAQKDALVSAAALGRFSTAVVLGGDIVMSEAARGFLDFTSMLASRSGGGSPSCVRLAGETRYDTSAMVADWAVSKRILGWDGVAFATSSGPYDALAGSVLQGKTRSALLLVGDATSPTIGVAASHRGSISSARIFGGDLVMPWSLRAYLDYSLQFGYAPRGGFRLSDGSWIAADERGVIPRLEAERRLIDTARSCLGVPYIWGGVYPDDGGMDCSSLSLYCYQSVGITIGDDTYTQVLQGYAVPFISARPGDLIFMYYWSAPTYSDRPEHVVVYAGNGMIYEEPNVGGFCQYVPLFSKNPDQLIVRRYLSNY